LKTFAAFSDEALPPIEAERFYRDLQPILARAQRARHRNRSRAIHAKIANRRKDFLHKLSTGLVKAHGAPQRPERSWNKGMAVPCVRSDP
jgi:putative transposase